MLTGQRPAEAGTSAGKTKHTGRGQPSATPGAAQPPRKWARILAYLLAGRSLNRFEAYRELRDSCLNTTVSQIEHRGVKVSRKEETVPGAFGPVRCCRYWLAPESLARARELLGLPASTDVQPAQQRAAGVA